MDDFSIAGNELEDTLDVLDQINVWLGGNKVVLDSLSYLNKKTDLLHTGTTILDVGCGSGDTLRRIAKWADRRHIATSLYGIDANEFTVNVARDSAADYNNIQFIHGDALENDALLEKSDIVICSLFLHHLTDEEIRSFIEKCFEKNVKAVIISDLHRHWLGYYLFQLVCFVFRVPHMIKHDGSLSVLRGFKREPLKALLQKTGYDILLFNWKWAFRYKIILTN